MRDNPVLKKDIYKKHTH